MSRNKAERELRKLVDKITDQFDERRKYDVGIVTDLIRDTTTDASGTVSQSGKVRKVLFTASGLEGQKVTIPDGTAISVGDSIQVSRSANRVTRPDWEFRRVIRSIQPFGQIRDEDRHVSTPTGFRVNSSSVYAPVPGGTTFAWVELTWTENPAAEGVSYYIVAYRKDGVTNWQTINDDAPTLRINELEVNTTYNFRIRAVNGLGNMSTWSSVINYTTGSDATLPKPPGGNEGDAITNLAADFSGRNCVITWDAVTDDDFDVYQIQIWDSSGENTKYRDITRKANHYSYAFDDNYEDTSGSPDASIYIKVRAQDYTGNVNTWATITATNGTPDDITGLAGSWNNQDLIITWDALDPVQGVPDFAYYKVSIWDDNTKVLKYRDVGITNQAGYAYRAEDNREDTGSDTPDTSVYVEVVAVDGFGQVSDNPASDTFTKAVPGSISNLSNDFTGIDMKLDWDDVTDPDFDKYHIEITIDAGTFDYYTRSSHFVYTMSMNVADTGAYPPDPSVGYAVSYIDLHGQESAASTTGSPAVNAAPSTPTGLAATGGFELITVTWDELTGYDDFLMYKLYASQNTGFTPDDGTNLVWYGRGTSFLHQVGYAETWYYKIKSLDKYDQSSAASSQVSATSHDIDTNTPDVPDNFALSSTIEEVYSGDFRGVIYATWDDPGGEPAAFQYELRWKLSTESDYEYKKTAVGATDDSIHNLIPAKTYDVNIRSLSRYGEASAWYNSGVDTQETITNDASAPSDVSDLAAVGAALKVTLTWTSPSEADSFRVIIYRNDAASHTGEVVVAIIACDPGSVQQYVDQFDDTTNPHTPGTTYYYWVKVSDRAGNISNYSNQASTALGWIDNNQVDEPAFENLASDLVFSITDADTVAWSSGTITLSGGGSYSINAGNTGNMVARTYIYLDENVSTTVLQTTTSPSTAVGSGKVLLAVAENGTTQASVQVFGGNGGLAGEVVSILNLSVLNADMGTLSAGEILLGNADTFGGSFTGVRMYESGSTYRVAGYNAGTLQAYLDSDGKLYAGGGAIVADEDGLSIDYTGVTGDTIPNLLTLTNSSLTDYDASFYLANDKKLRIMVTGTGGAFAGFRVSSSDGASTDDLIEFVLANTNVGKMIDPIGAAGPYMQWNYDIEYRELGSPPSAASSGYVSLYAKTDGKLYAVDDAGTEYDLTAAGGDVSVSGTPANNQIAVWTDASTIEGDANLTWTGTVFQIGTYGNDRLHVTASGSSGYSGPKRGIIITDATGPRLIFEDSGESSGNKVMLLKYEDQYMSFSSMNDAGSSWDQEDILTVHRDGAVGVVGQVFINESINSNLTIGLTINQGGNDDQLFALKSSDVAHGVTDYAETDTFFYITKALAGTGGANLVALTDSGTYSLFLSGIVQNGAGDSTRSTAALAPVVADAYQGTAGTGVQAMDANENLFAVRNYTSTVFLVDADGDIHYDGSNNPGAWDKYDDIQLLTGLRGMLARQDYQSRFAQAIEDARPVLEKTGVITYNNDGHHFVSHKGLTMLTIDAMRQLAAQNAALLQRIESLEYLLRG